MNRKIWLSGIFLVESLILYFLITDRFPVSGDDYSYLYQAKLFAAGKLWAENPLYDVSNPSHDCIVTNNLADYHGHRFSKYPPGWPILLAVGSVLKVPWLVDPLLGVLLVFLMTAYVEREMGDRLVNVTWLLLLSCLFFVYYAATQRAHIATALFIFGAFLAFQASEQRPEKRRYWLFIAGALLGYSVMTRYIDWVPLGAWIGIGLLWRAKFRELAAFTAGFAVLAAGNPIYHTLLFGHPFPAVSDVVGWQGPGTTMADRLIVSPMGFVRTGIRLANLIWVFPPTLLLALFCTRHNASSKTKMYLALFTMNVGIYFFYPAATGGSGPRYFLAYFPFLVLAVVDLYRQIRADGPPWAFRLWTLSLIALVVGNLVFALVETYTMYRRQDLDRTAQRLGPGQKVFLLKTGTYHTDARDLTRNPPELLMAENLYLNWCNNPERDALLKQFPGRKVFVYEYPSHLFPYVPNGNSSM